MGWCTGRRDITEIHVPLKTASNTIQSINRQLSSVKAFHSDIFLTLSQTTNFRLFQIQWVCKRQFQM